MTAESLFL